MRDGEYVPNELAARTCADNVDRAAVVVNVGEDRRGS